LEHLLGYLKEHGVADVILAMGYFLDPIKNCLRDYTQLGMRLTYLMEETPLGTAGAVKNTESYLDGPFVVLNGDIITGIDLTAMMKRHKEVKPKVSMALTAADNPTIYGLVETDTRGIVHRFVEKPSQDKATTNMINAGIYILEPEVLVHIPPSTPSMFENYLFPYLLEMDEPILGYPSDAYWIDIGTPERYLKANHDLLLQQIGRDVQAEGNSQLHPAAQIEGPLLIAEGCIIGENAKVTGPVVLGPHCEIGKGAVVQGAILWHHSRVGEKAVVKNCVVCSHSCVGQGSYITDNCMLGDSVTIASGKILAESTKVWPDGCAE
jgi:mannose-1-phosphate guanylyltransferase